MNTLFDSLDDDKNWEPEHISEDGFLIAAQTASDIFSAFNYIFKSDKNLRYGIRISKECYENNKNYIDSILFRIPNLYKINETHIFKTKIESLHKGYIIYIIYNLMKETKQ